MRSRRQGFSLVEALLAMTILGIAATGILTAFSASMVAGKLSEDYATTVNLAEILKAQVRGNLLSPLEYHSGSFTNYPEFSWEVNFYTTTLTDIYQVEIVIQWVRGQRAHEVRYPTYHFYPPATTETEVAAG